MARTKSDSPKPVYSATIGGKKYFFQSKTAFSRVLLIKGANLVLDSQRIEDAKGFEIEKVLDYNLDEMEASESLQYGLALQGLED